MKPLTQSANILVVIAMWMMLTTTSASAVERTYYQAVNGKSGQTLFSQLTTITNQGFHSLGYDGLYNAYLKTDVYPADSVGKAGHVWDMYSNCSWVMSQDKCGTYKNECDCFNREHSIPKSWFGGSTSGMGCDIFHVVPTDGKVNGMRGNYPYGEVGNATYTYQGSKVGSSSFPGYSGKVFEPRDEYKGDFARGYMGMILKWGTSKLKDAEASATFTTSTTPQSHYGLTSYGMALLMKWHREDPVSAKEIARNNGIQATQGNRNPFIDFPYLAEYFWGEHAGEAVDLSRLIGSFEADFVPGVSNGYNTSATATPVIPEECRSEKVMVNGRIVIRHGDQLYNIMGVKL